MTPEPLLDSLERSKERPGRTKAGDVWRPAPSYEQVSLALATWLFENGKGGDDKVSRCRYRRWRNKRDALREQDHCKAERAAKTHKAMIEAKDRYLAEVHKMSPKPLKAVATALLREVVREMNAR